MTERRSTRLARRAAYGREDGAVSGYARMLGIYLGSVGAAGVALRLTGRRLPTLGAGDLVLFGVATHHVAHLLAKEPIASPLRAPFTQFEGPSGPAELKESVQGEGLSRSIGELLTCPFCLGQWVATAFTLGAVAAPRLTRLAAALCTMAALSDGLQLVRSRLQS